jgi:5'-deoxynucleotidase YfbR-like HD superfamily hydrolase
MNLAKTFGMISGLSGTYRFSNAKLVHRESVLEHLGGVTLTCFLIISELNLILSNPDLGLDVMSKAVVHDVEELLMGDIPRTTKYATAESREAFKAMEENAVDEIMLSLELESGIMATFHAESKRGLSGLIVKIADTLAVVYKVHEEAIERGNKAMMGRATMIEGQLKNCRINVAASGFDENSKAFLIDLLSQADAIVASAKINVSETTIGEQHEGDRRQLRDAAK